MTDSSPNNISHQHDKLIQTVLENKVVKHVLESAGDLGLPHWYVGAGAIAQSVWNKFHGYEPTDNINDIDLVYYDNSDLTYEAEDKIISLTRERFSDSPILIDVKNQARVHLWYGKHFGYDISPYSSVEDAIRSWPTTATSIGIRKDGENYKVFAPYGLDDLFGLIVRANKVQITKDIYLKKAERWKNCWPELEVVPWEES